MRVQAAWISQTFTFTFYLTQQTGTSVKCYLEIADFVIISYIIVISEFLSNR